MEHMPVNPFDSLLERHEAINVIVRQHLLPVVAHCKNKISDILNSETYSKEFHAWVATRGDKKDETSMYIGHIKKAMAGNCNTVKFQMLLFSAIGTAYLLLHGNHIPERGDPSSTFQASGETTDTKITKLSMLTTEGRMLSIVSCESFHVISVLPYCSRVGFSSPF